MRTPLYERRDERGCLIPDPAYCLVYGGGSGAAKPPPKFSFAVWCPAKPGTTQQNESHQEENHQKSSAASRLSGVAPSKRGERRGGASLWVVFRASGENDPQENHYSVIS